MITITDCSTYAKVAKSVIQDLNDDVQLCINNYYTYLKDNNHNINDVYIHNIKSDLLSYIDSLHDILIEYIEHRKLCYDNERDKKFKFHIKFNDYIFESINVIDNTIKPIGISEISDDAVTKFIDINCIYESILNQFGSTDIEIDLYDINDIRICTSDEVITKLDSLLIDFLDIFESLRELYNDSDGVLTIIKLYMLELRNIVYIIQFIESIKLYD